MTVSVVAPSSIPAVERDPLTLSRVSVTNTSLTYGALLSFVDVFANDFTLWGNGIDPLWLYNGDAAYRVSLIAPKSAPTATSAASPSNVIRPISNECSSFCGVPGEAFGAGACARLWYDQDGVLHDFSSDPDGYICDQYQALNEATTNDLSYVYFSDDNQAGAVSVTQYLRLKLSNPNYQPAVDTGHSLTFRMRTDAFVGTPGTTNFRWKVYQGNPAVSGSAVLIKSSAYTEAALTGSFADTTISLSEGEASLITDYTNVYAIFELDDNPAAFPNGRRIQVSQVYMTLPTDGQTTLAAGEYGYAYRYVRSVTNTRSGLSPVLDYTQVGTGCITLDDLEVSDDADVDFIEILRTVSGGGEFFLLDTLPNDLPDQPTEGWLTDCLEDVDLAEGDVIDPARYRSYGALLPPKGRYLASYQNRVFTGGALLDAPYEAGTATFSNDSATVTGDGTFWTERMVGRAIKKQGATQYYRIAKVNSLAELEITAAFAESTSDMAAYTITDDRNPFLLSWSFPGGPEDWPVDYGIEVPGETGDGITGLVAHLGVLWVFTHDSIFRFSGDDESNFRLDLAFKGTGCISGHSISVAENTIYFQGEDGWYSFDGQQPSPLSSPPVSEGGARGLAGTASRVHQGRARMTVSAHDDERDVLLTYTSIDGAFQNDQAVCYDLRTGAFSIDDAPDVVSVGEVFGPTGETCLLLGDNLGCVYQANLGTSDGAYSGTIVKAVTSTDGVAITCDGAIFDEEGDGLVGVPAYLVDEDGNLMRLRVVENTADTVRSLRVLGTSETTSYTLVVGAIPWELMSGWVHYGAPRKPKVLEEIEWVYEPQDQGQVYVLFGEDHEEPHYYGAVDLTDATGLGHAEVGARGHVIKVGLRAFVPGFDVKVCSLQHFIFHGED